MEVPQLNAEQKIAILKAQRDFNLSVARSKQAVLDEQQALAKLLELRNNIVTSFNVDASAVYFDDINLEFVEKKKGD
jgi:hypothetical protein